jgi:predicted nuclease with TOPRIM domain
MNFDPQVQQIFNILVSIVGALCGWVFKTMWGMIRELDAERRLDKEKLMAETREVGEKLNRLETHMVGNYVSRADLRSDLNKLHDKLDNLLEKLEKKEDRRIT